MWSSLSTHLCKYDIGWEHPVWVQFLQKLTVTSHCPRLAVSSGGRIKDGHKRRRSVSVCSRPWADRIHLVHEITHQLWLIPFVLAINFEVVFVFKPCIALGEALDGKYRSRTWSLLEIKRQRGRKARLGWLEHSGKLPDPWGSQPNCSMETFSQWGMWIRCLCYHIARELWPVA